MSKIKNNPLLQKVSGMLGNVIVFREVRGKMIMANRPKTRDVLTPHQQGAKTRFLRAVMYAKKQIADPITNAEYATGITDSKISAYQVALTDYLSAPSISEIDTSRYQGAVGDNIVIRALDDFKVASVFVTITDGGGNLIEQGEALLQPDTLDEWRYTVTTVNASLTGSKVAAVVRDKPGNVKAGEKTL